MVPGGAVFPGADQEGSSGRSAAGKIDDNKKVLFLVLRRNTMKHLLLASLILRSLVVGLVLGFVRFVRLGRFAALLGFSILAKVRRVASL